MFLKEYNEKTSDKRGQIIPAEITIFEDRSFTFVLRLPPVSAMIKQAIKIQKGSGEAGKTPAGSLTMAQVEEIAKEKMPDMNTNDVEAAKRSVIGAAKSMGVTVN